MARGPGRPRLNQDVVEPDLIEGEFSEAISGDAKKTADEMADATDTISSLTGNDVQVLIYKASKSGPWEHVMELTPPIDMTEVVRDLKTQYGGGKYSFRVRAAGKIRTTKFVHLAVPQTLAPVASSLGGSTDIMAMMMQMQQQNQQSQSDNNRLMMQMQMEGTKMMMGVVTAIIGKPVESGSSSFLASVEALKALQGPQNQGGIKETIETMAALKSFMSDGNGGGESEEGLMGLAKQFLPALGGIATEVMKNQGGNNGQPMQVLPTPAPRVLGNGAGHGPAHVPAIAGAEGAGHAGAPPQTAPPLSSNPVVAAIRDDVLYLMRKPHPPEVAAEVIIASLEAAGISEVDFNGTAMEILAAGENWPAKVAEYGIDVTGREQWFSSVVTILAEHYGAGDFGGDAGEERDGGSETDLAANVSVGDLRRTEPVGP